MTQGELFQLAPPADAVPADGPPAAASWLDAVLETASTWRRSARAKLEACRKCGAWTLYAADMGLDLKTESRVDVTLLDRGLEVTALLAGRYTCELEISRHGGGPLIFRRDRWLAPTEPNARRRLWVPEHKCNNPLGHQLPLEMIFPFEHRLFMRSLNNDTKCPF